MKKIKLDAFIKKAFIVRLSESSGMFPNFYKPSEINPEELENYVAVTLEITLEEKITLDTSRIYEVLRDKLPYTADGILRDILKDLKGE